MLAEDGHLLDNMTYIEIESFVSFRGHSTALAGLRPLSGLEKQMQYVIACKLLAYRVLFIPGSTWQYASSLGTSMFGCCQKYPGEGEQVLFLRGHKWSGPSGHPPGPLGLCNPNEKRKPPPLPKGSIS